MIGSAVVVSLINCFVPDSDSVGTLVSTITRFFFVVVLPAGSVAVTVTALRPSGSRAVADHAPPVPSARVVTSPPFQVIATVLPCWVVPANTTSCVVLPPSAGLSTASSGGVVSTVNSHSADAPRENRLLAE